MTHAIDEAIFHGDHGRPPGTGAQRDVIETEGKRALHRQRAAEAHATEHTEQRPAFE